jgi:3-methyladenine DNA glycosylase AlkD
VTTHRQVRAALKTAADPAHAQFHKDYHKSELRFYGLRAAQLYGVLGELFPKKEQLARQHVQPLIDELLASKWFEENTVGLMLLERIQPQLTAVDMPYLRSITEGLNGWGPIDYFSLNTLGPLSLRLGEPVYKQVRQWSKADHMWTRRASILVHIAPARKSQLNDKYSWPTFEELLPEKEFFIRKAIGWTLRECSKKYPELVAEFLVRVGDRASGLTRREGGRNLPEELRKRVLS